MTQMKIYDLKFRNFGNVFFLLQNMKMCTRTFTLIYEFFQSLHVNLGIRFNNLHAKLHRR